MSTVACVLHDRALVHPGFDQLWLKGLTSHPSSVPDRKKPNRINYPLTGFYNFAASAQVPQSSFKTHCVDNTSQDLEIITSEEQFDSVLEEANQFSIPIIVDWMAAWCRKCIYLKPKLQKLAAEFPQHAKFYYVDVNCVPQSLVKRAGVNKMPTIQLWKDGEKCDEVIGGHQAWLVIAEVREMLQKHVPDVTTE